MRQAAGRCIVRSRVAFYDDRKLGSRSRLLHVARSYGLTDFREVSLVRAIGFKVSSNSFVCVQRSGREELQHAVLSCERLNRALASEHIDNDYVCPSCADIMNGSYSSSRFVLVQGSLAAQLAAMQNIGLSSSSASQLSLTIPVDV